MAYIKSLPENAGIGDVYRNWTDQYRPWVRMGQELMKGESELSEAEREMIATYVSVLNGCEYCRISHTPTMEKLGINPVIIDQLSEDINTAEVEAKIKPLLEFCRKLTLDPRSLSQDDADRVFAAGWGEEALHTAVGVTCRFNFMNRLTMGLGLTPLDKKNADALSKDRVELGYDMIDKGGIARRRGE